MSPEPSNDRQTAITATVTKFVDIGYPGFVQCVFRDANGCQQTFIDKVPVVACEGLDENSSYPSAGQIACEIISRKTDENGRSVILVDTSRPWHIASTTGETRFEIFEEQLAKVTWS